MFNVIAVSLQPAAAAEVYKAVGATMLACWAALEILQLLSARRRLTSFSAGSGVLTAARAMAVVGLGMGAVGTYRSGKVGFSPFSTFEATIDLQQAWDELKAVDVRCAAEREQLRLDRQRALGGIAAAQPALDAHEQALRAAESARRAAEQTAADARDAAYATADQEERDAGAKAILAYQAALPRLEDARAAAVSKAENNYNSRLSEIDQSVQPATAKAEQRAAARRDYDVAIKAAQTAYDDGVAQAADAQVKAQPAAQEKHIADIEAARRAYQTAMAAAATASDRAVASADQQLDRAIQAVPAARSVDSDFAQRRSALDTQCEQQKQAILDRVRKG